MVEGTDIILLLPEVGGTHIPINCTNRQRPAGPLLRHAGQRAGGRGGVGVADARSCPACNCPTADSPEVRRCEGVHHEDNQSAEYRLGHGVRGGRRCRPRTKTPRSAEAADPSTARSAVPSLAREPGPFWPVVPRRGSTTSRGCAASAT